MESQFFIFTSALLSILSLFLLFYFNFFFSLLISFFFFVLHYGDPLHRPKPSNHAEREFPQAEGKFPSTHCIKSNRKFYNTQTHILTTRKLQHPGHNGQPTANPHRDWQTQDLRPKTEHPRPKTHHHAEIGKPKTHHHTEIGKPKTDHHAKIGKPKTHHLAEIQNPRPTTTPRSANPRPTTTLRPSTQATPRTENGEERESRGKKWREKKIRQMKGKEEKKGLNSRSK
jgi:hypothetical protein